MKFGEDSHDSERGAHLLSAFPQLGLNTDRLSPAPRVFLLRSPPFLFFRAPLPLFKHRNRLPELYLRTKKGRAQG